MSSKNVAHINQQKNKKQKNGSIKQNESTNDSNPQESYQPEDWSSKKGLPAHLIKIKAEAKTQNHGTLIKAIKEGKSTITNGCAGTGKTFISLNQGLQAVAENEYDFIVIFRSTVDVRDNGFLPGSEKEKNAPYEEPYQLIVQEIFNRPHSLIDYQILTDKNLLKFKSTRFNQGITLRNAFIIVDEAQNLTYKELYNIFTRQGEGCVIHFCGDYVKQDFLKKEKSGYKKFIDVINSSEPLKSHFEQVNMTPNDVLRADIVKEFILADYNYIDD